MKVGKHGTFEKFGGTRKFGKNMIGTSENFGRTLGIPAEHSESRLDIRSPICDIFNHIRDICNHICDMCNHIYAICNQSCDIRSHICDIRSHITATFLVMHMPTFKIM